jgi:chitinase
MFDKSLKILILGFVLTSASIAQSKLIVGYYPSWSKSSYPHTVVQYKHLTHIAHAFIFPNTDGSLDLSEFTHYPELIQSAHQNGVKVVISVGGWNPKTPRFRQMVADSNARKRFVAALKAFCTTYGYDGADIDWEYPEAQDRMSGVQLFRELREAFPKLVLPLSLSIAAPSSDWQGGYDWAVMNEVLDWIGVMTYDFYGSWTSKAGPNSPLYGNATLAEWGWIDNSVSYYKGKGVPLAKLLIGIPFYGWQFNASAMYGASSGASQLPYDSIAPLLQQGWTRTWDTTTKVPHIINADRTRVISYDDTVSISDKTSYVKAQQLGGTIIWALGQDYLLNGQQPLLSAVGNGLRTTTGIAHAIVATIPKSCELLQNFPNPFNAQTRIRYYIARAGRYVLRISDVLGRGVTTLADHEHQPGSYEVTISSDALSSGVYLYRLSGEGTMLTRTMVVLR